ncbi:FtsK/SpoIIIE domain-containing protein [Chungangia koreensis]|uniref:FtsK/SpoIIIE domain-containing protein n=1 Tax=Chungangia koreensis TaxID=752657 RepID=A0ABV8X0H7_9LACT
MILEVGSTIVMAGIAGWAYLKQNGPATNDAEKIQRIFANTGMMVKEQGKTKTIRLQKKRTVEGGTEYVYQLPLGMSSKQVQEAKHVLEDGLNVRHEYLEFNPSDLKNIRWNENVFPQIKQMIEPKKSKKEIDIDFDGMLKIRVYNEPLSDYLQWNDSYFSTGWRVPVGENRKGFIYHDFAKTPHIIVAGTTGFGKSQYLKMLVTSLITQQPNYVHLSLIDLKGGTAFQRFSNMQQVEYYGRNPVEARQILQTVQQNMNTMLEKIVESGFEDTREAGIKDRHFIIVDEAADMAQDGICMDIVADIARRGRGAGYHLIYCTQYPTNETIPSQVRPNIGARVCFKLKTNIQSRAVLDEGGAEDLPEIRGRAIYQLNKNIIVQTPYMTNDEISDLIAPFMRKGGPHEQTIVSKTKSNRQHSLEFEEA